MDLCFYCLLYFMSMLIFLILDQSENYYLIDVLEKDEHIYTIMQSVNNSSKTCLYYSDSLNKFETKYSRSLADASFDKQYIKNKKNTRYSLEYKNGICAVNPGF